jgi:cytochrome c553
MKGNIMKNFIKSALFIMLLGFIGPTFAQDESAAKLDKQLCSLCHGLGGNTTSEQFPMLAGQNSAYFINQLKAFRDKSRSNQNAMRFMWGISSRLSDDEIEKLANYYENQTPAHNGKVSNPQKYDLGMRLFLNGDENKGVPACAACHGEKGQGTVGTPRLAGQHEEYLKKQLKVFYGNERPAAVAMHEIAKTLSDNDIDALSHYLQAQ